MRNKSLGLFLGGVPRIRIDCILMFFGIYKETLFEGLPMTEAVEPEGLAQNFPNAWDVGVTQSGLARDYQNHWHTACSFVDYDSNSAMAKRKARQDHRQKPFTCIVPQTQTYATSHTLSAEATLAGWTTWLSTCFQVLVLR